MNALVKEHVTTYLKAQKAILIASEFKELVTTLETEGISSIWAIIASPIKSELMSEFGVLFNNDMNHRQFIDIVSVYQDVDLDAVFESYKKTESLSTPMASCISEDNTANSSSLGFFSGQKRNREEMNDLPEEQTDLKHSRGS
ncbi:MAG: hypothetical protein CK426_03580 [Legionella sp.]|nr:MAG: hypothetical protein CK426_03580 [Legionella sp.]